MTFSRKYSTATLQQWDPISTDGKESLSSKINKATEKLSYAFAFAESPEELIYNLFKLPHKEEASIGKLLTLLKNFGLQENDPRLHPMMEKIIEMEKSKEEEINEAYEPKHWKMNKDDFKRCVSESLYLVARTLQNDLVIPRWNHFCSRITELFELCKPIIDGVVTNHIPQLSRFDPKFWGVSICTIDGQRAHWGDSKVTFSVESVSKAFNYAIAASELGADIVHKYVGQEPSGRLFNEICLDSQNKPHNPMVNSGAIIVSSLIKNELNIADRFDYVLTEYKKIAGGEYVGFNNSVFLAERATADRSYALTYYLKENRCFPPETKNLSDELDFYFQLRALEVNCETAAVMAATLANGGVCPITDERCIKPRPCRDVLSLMNSCGMYDYSGQFSFHVGLPAKSGISGVLLVVIPNLLGIALWSPPLDKLGNSVRGVKFCRSMIQHFNFHNYDSLAHSDQKKFDPRKQVRDREKNVLVALLYGAKAGDLNAIRRKFMQGVDMGIMDYDKRTALHIAASEGHLEVIKFLLHVAKVDPEPKDRWNRTPFQDAQDNKHTAVANLLERYVKIQSANAAENSKPAVVTENHVVHINCSGENGAVVGKASSSNSVENIYATRSNSATPELPLSPKEKEKEKISDDTYNLLDMVFNNKPQPSMLARRAQSQERPRNALKHISESTEE